MVNVKAPASRPDSDHVIGSPSASRAKKVVTGPWSFSAKEALSRPVIIGAALSVTVAVFEAGPHPEALCARTSKV